MYFSSATAEWSTPQSMFDALNDEFGFTLDAAASHENAKCPRYLTREIDALSCDWSLHDSVFLNPPYGHSIGRWVKKARAESRNGATVVALIPAKTETRWWHDQVMYSSEIRLIRGRMRFSGSKINAPFPSAVVVFRPHRWIPVFTTMDRILDSEQMSS